MLDESIKSRGQKVGLEFIDSGNGCAKCRQKGVSAFSFNKDGKYYANFHDLTGMSLWLSGYERAAKDFSFDIQLRKFKDDLREYANNL